MIHKSINNIKFIKKEVDSVNKNINIIAISKTFPVSEIMPLVNDGHQHFGENKVQEAVEKWTDIKARINNIKLHLVGRLQTNKVKFCLPLFDYIHSLDNERLAEKISSYQEKKNFKPKIFVQVNFDNEKQKGGIDIKNLEIFVKKCLNDYKLNIIGLMCIPPNNETPEKYFKELRASNELLGFNELSMGMSNDYKLAIENGATYIRIGSKIFGNRTNKS
tara:strand:- start:628 stop:1284 length:657 start_codon:yes stop_codon:yes gene_type:complete